MFPEFLLDLNAPGETLTLIWSKGGVGEQLVPAS